MYGLDELAASLNRSDRLLLVDDVHDTGHSIERVIEHLQSSCAEECPQIRVAVPWYKPSRNETELEPDYFVHKTSDWLVFPHELDALSPEELKSHRPDIAAIVDSVKSPALTA